MASALVNPIQFPAEWDVIRTGSRVSPGFCVISGFERKQEFDVKKGKGTKGATITYVQQPPVEGEIEFFLWDDGTLGTGHDHFAEWEAFKPQLKFDPTKKEITAIPVYHPSLADNDITSLVCTEIGPLTRTKELMYSSKCKFLEYTAQPKGSAVGTAKKSKEQFPGGPNENGSGTREPEPDAPTAQEQEIQKLTDQYNGDAADNAAEDMAAAA